MDELIASYRKLAMGVHKYDAFDQMIHTHHSTAIEGSSLTLDETQTLLEKGLTAAGKPLVDHLMVLDHQEALRYVLSLSPLSFVFNPLSSVLSCAASYPTRGVAAQLRTEDRGLKTDHS